MTANCTWCLLVCNTRFAMDRGLTPKKVTNKLNYCSRICKRYLAVKYGTRNLAVQ